MSRFDELQHRRAADGKFTTKPTLAASTATLDDVEAAANETDRVPEPRVRKVQNGCYQVDSSVPDPEPTGDGQVTRIHLVSEPAHRARLEATVDSYPRPADLTSRLEAAADTNAKVTLLRQHEDSISGARRVLAEEVTMVRSTKGQLVCLRKGARSRGSRVTPDDVLDMQEGWNGTGGDLIASYNDHRNDVPGLSQLDQADLDQVPQADPMEPPPSAVALTVFGTHPGFAGERNRSAGCVWFITDYDKDNDIANGYMWAPSDSGLYSEHGSVPGRYLRTFGGKTSTPPGMSFRDCMELPDDRSSVWGMLR